MRLSANKSITIYLRSISFSPRVWAASNLLKFHQKQRDALVKQVRRSENGRVLTQDIVWRRTAYVANLLNKSDTCIPMEIQVSLLTTESLPEGRLVSRPVAHVSDLNDEYRIRYMDCDTSCTRVALQKILEDYGYRFVAWVPDRSPERE